ncbi:uncharacterized protein FIESC28_05870 [Fusarium coffeatum]|uniref:C2H2-type domain-containing protein n=1 Tax=Fusarium coffeatum TaxID=231269 RepID=A0A366RQZ3_9HYPO|nr:uncharacterized protein FIESC28_05870 [Fusarium coffeatum]RBR18820.1 hypothetical protein FIESC28_05870 [Fusarium coffeatum]
MDHDEKPGLIASHVAKTLESFQNFEGALSKAARSNDVLEGATLNKYLLQTENDFTRFKMWVGNQTAHQSGPSSLDGRLREAAHLQQQVTYLLKGMSESLQTATSLVQDDPSFLVQSQEDGKHEAFQHDDSHSCSSDSAESDESDFSVPGSDNLPSSGLPTLLTDIGEVVDCLLRLSVATANPAPHEHFRKPYTKPNEIRYSPSAYERSDIEHVRKRFPSITDDMAKNLAKFITRRHRFFKDLEAHRRELASNRENDKYYTELIQEDAPSDDDMSQTTSAHHWLFAGTGPDTVPPRPSATEDGIFECPFCYRMICAKTFTAWRQHVFGDLRPYKCIDRNCIESNSDFDRRRDLQSHVSKYHWRSWSCPFKCQQHFPSAAELRVHIREHHFPAGTEDELKSITALGERDAPDSTSSPCPLCEHLATGLAEYIDHVGFHLEKLALFALPTVEVAGPLGWASGTSWIPESARIRDPGWLTKYTSGSGEESSSKPGADADSTHSLSARQPPFQKGPLEFFKTQLRISLLKLAGTKQQMRHLSPGEERRDDEAHRFARREEKKKAEEEPDQVFEPVRSEQYYGVPQSWEADNQPETTQSTKTQIKGKGKAQDEGVLCNTKVIQCEMVHSRHGTTPLLMPNQLLQNRLRTTPIIIRRLPHKPVTGVVLQLRGMEME